MANYSPKSLAVSKAGDTYTYDMGNVHYGASSTAAGTQTKAVSIPEIESLVSGLCVRVKFTNAQDYNGQPKLQINSLTATNIVRNGTTAAAQYEWQAGEVVDFLYDGTNFVMLEGAIPTTTYYGSRIKLNSTTNSTSTTEAATPSAVKAAYDLAASKTANTGTITAVQANGTNVATSGTANIPAASTSAYGVTKLNSATNSTSTTEAATPSAVKSAYDLANGKVSCTEANVKSALGIGSETTKYLREDGTWAVPPDTWRPLSDILAAAYPVGSIYMSVADTSPETLFGGTWEQLKDKFLLGAGDTYTAGTTGGSASHTLTTNEMPSHSHSLNSHTHTYGKVNSPTGGPSNNSSSGTAITTAQLASHTHKLPYADTTVVGNTGSTVSPFNYGTNSHTSIATGSGNTHSHTLNNHTHTTGTTSTNSGTPSNNATDSKGSGTAFSIMPPYLAVYMWKRTA